MSALPPDAQAAAAGETLPPDSLTARLEPELVDLLRAIAPQIRKASRAWRRGLSDDECAMLVFGLGADRLANFGSLLAVTRADRLTPPTWLFPERPPGFNAPGALTLTLEWIDRWCDAEDLPGARRLLAARIRRDCRHSMREHQRAKLGDAGRPRAEPWGGQ